MISPLFLGGFSGVSYFKIKLIECFFNRVQLRTVQFILGHQLQDADLELTSCK